MNANFAWVRGIQAADVSCRPIFGIGVISSWKAALQKGEKRFVRIGVVHLGENLVRLREEVALLQLAIECAPEVTLDFVDSEIVLLQGEPDFRGKAMDELRAKFNAIVECRIALREYASADAITSFEDFDFHACPSEIECSSQAGCTGANHDDIRRHYELDAEQISSGQISRCLKPLPKGRCPARPNTTAEKVGVWVEQRFQRCHKSFLLSRASAPEAAKMISSQPVNSRVLPGPKPANRCKL